VRPAGKPTTEESVREYFATLYRTWGPQHWWPAESPFEVIVGAFLTQNTAWTNVELALQKLRTANVHSMNAIRQIAIEDLEQLIRSAGYFRQKAKRLKTFIAYVDATYGGSLDRLFAQNTNKLREELLSLNGIGPETADSILLYAGQHEVFVVDAYTRRIFERHRLIKSTAAYDEVRKLVERSFTPAFVTSITSAAPHIQAENRAKPPAAYHTPSAMSEAPRSATAQMFNEFHGLIVGVGKNFCQARRVLCEQCPLREFLDQPVKLALSKPK
jgi:endonuclease III related protein